MTRLTDYYNALSDLAQETDGVTLLKNTFKPIHVVTLQTSSFTKTLSNFSTENLMSISKTKCYRCPP